MEKKTAPKRKPLRRLRPTGRFYFILGLLCLSLIAVFLLIFKPWDKDHSIALPLEEGVLVHSFGKDILLYQKDELSCYRLGEKRWGLPLKGEDPSIATLHKTIYFASGKTLQKIDQKGNLLESYSLEEPIFAMESRDKTLYLFLDKALRKFQGETSLDFPTAGYLTDFSKNNSYIFLTHVKEEEGILKSQLTAFDPEGNKKFTFTFIDEVMEKVAAEKEDRFYLLTDKHAYHFQGMALLDKSKLLCLNDVEEEKNYLHYLDYKKQIKLDKNTGYKKETYWNKEYRNIYAHDKDLLLLSDTGYRLNEGEEVFKADLYGALYHQGHFYLITAKGLEKI